MKHLGSILCALILGLAAGARATDYAAGRHADQWLRHPVYGDPSFDAFERLPANPLHRGAPPYEWPVNGFLFHDPVGGADYVYIGDYCQGYLPRPSRCVLYRSSDGMRSWTNLGVVVQGEAALFDQGGHTPDASVVFDGGRYHMVYDWGVADFNQDGGLAYAWADRPEGPWHRAPEPITRNSTLPKLLGRYQRTYAGTLVRRKHDWLITAMMDAPPNAWALFVMTAPTPAGPWSERRLVRHVEDDSFHPPLLEFYPAFTRDGYLYAPATSVALNRNFNALFRAPLAKAAEPAAWEIAQCGSLWHSEPVEAEHYGLWGQTFSGWVDTHDTFWAMFPSRDAGGCGTINLARRPWAQPLRERGFVLSGHQGPSFTCLRRTYGAFNLEARLQLNGTALVLWDWHGALGPERPQSDATLHALARSRFQALELSPGGWALLRVDERGQRERLASGAKPEAGPWQFKLVRSGSGVLRLSVGQSQVWLGQETPFKAPYPGAMGLWVEPGTHVAVEQFRLTGREQAARIAYLGLEGLLGAGAKPGDWTELRGTEFRFGVGLVSKSGPARVKWNVAGRRLSLWSPRGPGFGTAEILLDGRRVGKVDLHAARLEGSQPVWRSQRLGGTYHALVCRSLAGSLPVDCLEAED